MNMKSLMKSVTTFAIGFYLGAIAERWATEVLEQQAEEEFRAGLDQAMSDALNDIAEASSDAHSMGPDGHDTTGVLWLTPEEATTFLQDLYGLVESDPEEEAS